jgi:hypothetical protein
MSKSKGAYKKFATKGSKPAGFRVDPDNSVLGRGNLNFSKAARPAPRNRAR